MIASCFCWSGEPDWEAIGAIGQVLGAIATFLAVLVALRLPKAKLKMKFSEKFATMPDDDRIQVIVANDSRISIKIKYFGFKVGNGSKIWALMGNVGGLPFILEPHDDKDFSIAHLNIARLIQDDYTGIQTVSLLVMDSKQTPHLVKRFPMDIEKYVKRRMP